MVVCVVNPMGDMHGKYMLARLLEKQIPCIELAEPTANDYTLCGDQLMYNGQPIQRGQIQGVYFRSVMQDPEQWSVHNDDRHVSYTRHVQFSAQMEAVKTWMRILTESGIPVINPPRNYGKYYQLHALKQLGIRMPATCITSSVKRAREFVTRVGQAVCKPLPGGSYCRKVTPELLKEMEQGGSEPIIFQEYVPGVDVRVNMIDGSVISSHIIRQSSPEMIDYRIDPEYASGNAQYEHVQLPQQAIRDCGRAMERLGLRFSGIDLRRTPDNEFVLIECNSMPAYLDIEFKTRTPITDKLIAYVSGSQHEQAQQTTNEATYSHSSRTDGVTPTDTSFGTSGKSDTVQFAGTSGTDDTNRSPGRSIFNYVEVMQQWSESEHKKGRRAFLPLNAEQKRQIFHGSGKEGRMMEVEESNGTVRVVRIW